MKKLPERIYAIWSETPYLAAEKDGLLDAVAADPKKWFSHYENETAVGIYKLVEVMVVKPKGALERQHDYYRRSKSTSREN